MVSCLVMHAGAWWSCFHVTDPSHDGYYSTAGSFLIYATLFGNYIRRQSRMMRVVRSLLRHLKVLAILDRWIVRAAKALLAPGFGRQ